MSTSKRVTTQYFIWSKSSFVVYSVLWQELFFFWLIQDLEYLPLNVKLELKVNRSHTQRKMEKKNDEKTRDP